MLYTFILGWDSGIFVSQCDSEDVDGAIQKWSVAFDLCSVGASEESKSQFLAGLDGETPVLVDHLMSVWCVCTYIEGLLAVIHIIKTESESVNLTV